MYYGDFRCWNCDQALQLDVLQHLVMRAILNQVTTRKSQNARCVLFHYRTKCGRIAARSQKSRITKGVFDFSDSQSTLIPQGEWRCTDGQRAYKGSPWMWISTTSFTTLIATSQTWHPQAPRRSLPMLLWLRRTRPHDHPHLFLWAHHLMRKSKRRGRVRSKFFSLLTSCAKSRLHRIEIRLLLLKEGGHVCHECFVELNIYFASPTSREGWNRVKN